MSDFVVKIKVWKTWITRFVVAWPTQGKQHTEYSKW